MAKAFYIVQDRWCSICSAPAAFQVFELRIGKLMPVCSIDHGEELIRQKLREREVEKAGTAPKARV